MRGRVILTCDNHYRPTNAMWAHDLCTLSGSLMGKTKNLQRHMTQIANVLAVPTVPLTQNIYI